MFGPREVCIMIIVQFCGLNHTDLAKGDGMSYGENGNGGRDRYKLIKFPRNNSPLSRLSSPTIAIIAINAAIFILLEVVGSSQDLDTLITFGAKVNLYVRAGEWWRIFTAMFLHFGVFHILVNSYSLYNLGSFSERVYGKWRFVAIYLTAGIAGNILSTILGSLYSVGVGASGAVFGVAGSILYLGVRRPELFKYILGSSFIVSILLNLFIGFAIPGIDVWAHIGGLIGGFAASWAIGTQADEMNGGPAWWKGALVYGALGLLLAYILS